MIGQDDHGCPDPTTHVLPVLDSAQQRIRSLHELDEVMLRQPNDVIPELIRKNALFEHLAVDRAAVLFWIDLVVREENPETQHVDPSCGTTWTTIETHCCRSARPLSCCISD